MANQIPGFDYTAGKLVAHTAKEWRGMYAGHRRVSADGETAYYGQHHPCQGNGPTTRRHAEAYAIIPAGGAK